MGGPGGVLEATWGGPEWSWGDSGGVLGILWPMKRVLEGNIQDLLAYGGGGGVLGCPGEVLEWFWWVLSSPGEVLGRSWRGLGGVLGIPWHMKGVLGANIWSLLPYAGEGGVLGGPGRSYGVLGGPKGVLGVPWSMKRVPERILGGSERGP